MSVVTDPMPVTVPVAVPESSSESMPAGMPRPSSLAFCGSIFWVTTSWPVSRVISGAWTAAPTRADRPLTRAGKRGTNAISLAGTIGPVWATRWFSLATASARVALR